MTWGPKSGSVKLLFHILRRGPFRTSKGPPILKKGPSCLVLLLLMRGKGAPPIEIRAFLKANVPSDVLKRAPTFGKGAPKTY